MLIAPFWDCWIGRGWRFNIRVWGCIGEIYTADSLKRAWRRVNFIFNSILSWFSNSIKCWWFGDNLRDTRSFRGVSWLIIQYVALRALLILIIVCLSWYLIFLLVFNQNFIIGDASLLIFLFTFYLGRLQWKIQWIGELRRIKLFLNFVTMNQSSRR